MILIFIAIVVYLNLINYYKYIAYLEPLITWKIPFTYEYLDRRQLTIKLLLLYKIRFIALFTNRFLMIYFEADCITTIIAIIIS